MHTSTPAQLVAALNWRYATKQFDPQKKIPADAWSALEQSLVLAPSSFGLQPWKFIVVTSPELKQKLVAASWNQTQPADCSHYVVFAFHKNVGEAHIERYMARTAQLRSIAVESLAPFKNVILKSILNAKKTGTLDQWQSHQVYIALGQFMAAAAMLGVDSCPMEGLDPAKYDEILGLKGTDYATLCACAAGYRAATDKYATAPKVRFEAKDVIQYL